MGAFSTTNSSGYVAVGSCVSESASAWCLSVNEYVERERECVCVCVCVCFCEFVCGIHYYFLAKSFIRAFYVGLLTWMICVVFFLLDNLPSSVSGAVDPDGLLSHG
jgi:hypothetical protein